MATIDERYRDGREQQQTPVTSRAHPGIYAIVISPVRRRRRRFSCLLRLRPSALTAIGIVYHFAGG